MKKVFHLCHSSKEEVLFRNHDDYNWGFNSYALALYKTESCSLADAHMSDHRHLISQTDSPEKMMRINRLSYTRHMNTKYGRRGPLGESECFITELDGLYRLITALTYTMRNALHHGIAPTPFAYPHSSANIIFRDELGKHPDAELLSERNYHAHVGRNVEIPNDFKMDKSGLFLRENITAVKQVELLYGTPKSFLYYMNRPSDDKWLDEQRSESSHSPLITMELIEQGVLLTDPGYFHTNEKGRQNYGQMSDIDLCEVIDSLVVNQYKSKSVYTLLYSHKQELYHMIRELYHVNEMKARRCLAMDYT